jgi:deoxyribonuclease I
MRTLEALAMEKEMAVAELTKSRTNRTYFDEKQDMQAKVRYYEGLCSQKKSIEIESLHLLLTETHANKLEYSPHRYLYPWVDLQENASLKSLYSGNRMDPLSSIEHDLKLHELRGRGMITVFSGDNLLNCEHVVPQSWFHKQEPMRGDLHHLFSCEPNCNSSRGNSPYYDFSDYVPETKLLGIKEGCGKSDQGKFEPEYGKGIVARATFYFLTRYRKAVNQENINIPMLLEWHQKFSVTKYEKHRNLAIHELQGNRNPFIDFPELAVQLAEGIN